MKEIIETGKVPFPRRVKHAIKKTPRVLTSWARLLPDFLIIGAQKGGTTSLYNYLTAHPYIAPVFRKEVHFFDNNFWKGTIWYRAYFPSVLQKYYAQKIRGQDFVTGEASPYYIFHPHVPKRVAQLLPQVKIIAVLRNPIDRAYSHYQHEVRKGWETLSFEEALAQESARIEGEYEKILRDENYYSFNHQHYSYLSRGLYIEQLDRWMQFFPKEQFLILKSEDLYTDPSATVQKVFAFLRLSNYTPQGYDKIYKQASYPNIPAPMRKHLGEYFARDNQRLYSCLGMNFGWDN